MASFKVVMPKLGESIIEATITKWLKKEGDPVGEDDPIVEIATDKVDSEIPSPVEGILGRLYYKEGDVVAVGEVIAEIRMEGVDSSDEGESLPEGIESKGSEESIPKAVLSADASGNFPKGGRFYSPLVKNMARQEKISVSELDSIPGSGKDGRLTKADLLAYIGVRTTEPATVTTTKAAKAEVPASSPALPPATAAGDEVIPMDRMRKLIADHMVMSVQTSPHVTSIVEVDMTAIVHWREKQKDVIQKRYNEKLTFTHIFIEAIARTIREFPMVNASVDGSNIILRKQVNIGMAVALPSGNLIVPVIRNADQKNLLGIIRDVNDIADRARNNKLVPDEVQGGTITLTNLGSFGTVMGTPIINQPQVAIVAVGAIVKRPVVVETAQGDMIAVRHMMYLSLSYDHRIIDGALGGKFIYRMKELLEQFDTKQII
ncbi:MAG TPA: dihydrolipoamide acetyltransferase family protein [Bacteroidales bacterium]|nr:dihydrolipoamide acetyltransferase family protein [Bacteroidales bacterium]HSA42534.1 dihydrolipoamide acetyltransferase family protein [Bacteroidales bacterium]